VTADLPSHPPQDPVLRDDRLLDAIARGEPPPADHPTDDPLLALLAGWQAGVVARARQLDSLAEPVPDEGPATGRADAPQAPPPPAPRRLRRVRSTTRAVAAGARGGRRRRRTAFAGAALTLVTVAGGLWVGAARAEPGDLFWPVTELVYANRAESLTAEREVGRVLDQARQDIVAGRYADARHHLEQAVTLLGTVGDDDRVTRLRADVDALGRLLPPSTAPAPAPRSSTPAVPPVTGPGASPQASSLEPSGDAPADGERAPSDPASSHSPAPPARTPPAPAGLPAEPTGTAPARPPARPSRHVPPAVPAPTGNRGEKRVGPDAGRGRGDEQSPPTTGGPVSRPAHASEDSLSSRRPTGVGGVTSWNRSGTPPFPTTGTHRPADQRADSLPR
jgi:hypothetical protein